MVGIPSSGVFVGWLISIFVGNDQDGPYLYAEMRTPMKADGSAFRYLGGCWGHGLGEPMSKAIDS